MKMDRPDPYAVLGLAPGATQDQIGRAYRALLRQHHPDTRAPGDPPHDALSDAALQHVLAAYAVLRDPIRRADYDQQTGADSRPPVPPTPPETPARYESHGRPPIVAGPVRWHRGPDPRHSRR